MGQENGNFDNWPPIGAPLLNVQKDEHLSNFDNSVHAVSFGFVATAILISMFLVMAIFERFLRSTSPSGDLESQIDVNGKPGHPSPKACTQNSNSTTDPSIQKTVYADGVSVLMPGDEIPSFIAHPVPVPVACPPERNPWPQHHQHNPDSSNPSSSSNPKQIQLDRH